MIYSNRDLQDIIDKKVSINEVALKYHSSVSAVRRAMNRRKMFIRNKRILIKSPFKTKVVDSIQECADELDLSVSSIKNALNGNYPKILKELGITLEVYKNAKQDD